MIDYLDYYNMCRKHTEIVPEGEKGSFRIQHFSVDREACKKARFEAILSFNFDYAGFEPGNYVRLVEGQNTVMSNTDMEIRTNWWNFVKKAHGNILVAGLGIGMIFPPLAKDPNVSNVTIVEKNQEVIDLVYQHLKLPKNFSYMREDIFNLKTNYKFDCIYFDIWTDINGDNYLEMKELNKIFKYKLNRQNPNCFMTSWRIDDVRKLNKE